MDRFQNTRQPDWEWWDRLWESPQSVLESVGVERGDSVVDIGSGNGYFTIAAGTIVAPGPVYAIDIDTALLSELGVHTRRRGLENVYPIAADARQLATVLSTAVDVLLLANTYHGIEHPRSFVQQAADRLTSDGRLIVINWHDRPKADTPVDGQPRGPPESLRLSPAATIAQLPDGLFTDTSVVDLPPYHYALVCQR